WWRLEEVDPCSTSTILPNLHHPPPTCFSEQPPQLEGHPDRIRLAAQHEPAHHAVGAQRLPSVAQVALRHAASVDQEELVAHRDPGLRAGAPRHDVIDTDVLH